MEDKKEGKIVIDPRIFISEPYLACPSCKREGSFGVLMISA